MPAASTATTSQAANNLLRWQSRLRTHEARLRHRQAEARQLYPGDEARQIAHYQDEAAKARFAAGGVEQARRILAEQQAPSGPPAAGRPWWRRVLGLLRGKLPGRRA